MVNHPTEASFLKDVAKHTMTVLMDQGNSYRHIRFSQAGSSNMYFDLITVPGKLIYTGDMGTYVFERLRDMFDFFRTDSRDGNGSGKLGINTGYWSEKLIATSSCGPRSLGAEEFDEKHFDSVLYEKLVCWIKENRNETDRDERRDLWDTVVSDVFEADADSGGFRKQIAAHDFYHHVNDDVGGFSFVDLFDHRFTKPTYHFVWACYAIAWGIQQWDMANGPVKAV